MARKELKKITTIDDNDPIQVESAIRDGVGDNIENKYAQQDGAYENLWAGNLITDTNWRWVNDFVFGTGTVDTVFDGEATIYAIRGKTQFSEIDNTPSYVNVVSNKSVIFNLYNPTLGYAHVVESDNENNGLCVSGTDIVVGTIMQFAMDKDFINTLVEVSLTEETNSTGETYLHCNAPFDGYCRVKNAEPSDLCISNVWGGNRVSYHPAYEEYVVQIGSASSFPTGMKSIAINGEDVVYDELYANKYFARVLAVQFSSSPSLTYVTASGTYNIYRYTLSDAMNKGACQIGGSTKFAWSDVGTMSSSTPISADTMSLASGYIYFAIAKSEDSTYTYSEDTDITDQASFESELASKGALYTLVDGEYVSVTTYASGTTYYYVSATNVHGLNGQAISTEIANKTIVYQRYSMDKTEYAGVGITPAKNWSYKMGDFGTEELTLASGYPVTPYWVVYYPVNVLETVQQLPNNYVSLESAENLLHQVGELQGFDFDNISVDEETGNMKVNGLVDTKETIVYLDIYEINNETHSKILAKCKNNITVWVRIHLTLTSTTNVYSGWVWSNELRNCTIIYDTRDINFIRPNGEDYQFGWIIYLANSFKGLVFWSGYHFTSTHTEIQLWQTSYRELSMRPKYARYTMIVQKFDNIGNCYMTRYSY